MKGCPKSNGQPFTFLRDLNSLRSDREKDFPGYGNLGSL
jgi:hypothetical protein